ncbi:MAG: hypothetical protein A4S09_01320 [Proteobacteria bacterium SG_bin7]|nr:MAG: hypothetical protein A4S09_01320 [Proteobacteria bacterium SG_bin7]
MQIEFEKDKNLSEIVAKLKAHFNPLKIYLFGSRAHGTANSDSDYDLFLVVKESNQRPIERMKKAHEILWGCKAPADIFIYTEVEFNEYKDEFSSIANTVVNEGVEL